MTFDLDSFFQDFLGSDKIFVNRDVLRPEFIPNNLPHRDTQIRKIGEVVACSLKSAIPSNLFLFGKTGTGKTAVTKHVNEALNTQFQKHNLPEPRWIYLNCQEVNTTYRVWAKICDQLDPEHPVPIAGWPLDVIFDTLLARLDKHVNGLCFIVLDEIDILAKNTRSSTDIFYNLIRINAKLKQARVSVVGISNVLNFKSFLDPRVLSSLCEEEIIFPSYDALELKDILEQRSEKAFYPDVLEEGVLNLCGALAAKEHGDARKALDLLRKAGELAERRQAQIVTTDHLYWAQDEIESDKMQEYFDQLPIQQKTVFMSIYQLQRYRNGDAIITGDVYACYSELYQLVPGLSCLSQRRVSVLIKELDLAGLINAQLKSRGRKGRTKFISLNLMLEEAYKYLSTESRFEAILDYKPQCVRQTRLNKFTNQPNL